MAQPFIVEITSSGTIVLPEEIRKYIPPGTKFTVSQQGITERDIKETIKKVRAEQRAR
jgi:bifunctional DNA-binding transcriptional regulator/antitoxin component of YhaV-PrlF toxin-antitoxin module